MKWKTTPFSHLSLLWVFKAIPSQKVWNFSVMTHFSYPFFDIGMLILSTGWVILAELKEPPGRISSVLLKRIPVSQGEWFWWKQRPHEDTMSITEHPITHPQIRFASVFDSLITASLFHIRAWEPPSRVSSLNFNPLLSIRDYEFALFEKHFFHV